MGSTSAARGNEVDGTTIYRQPSSCLPETPVPASVLTSQNANVTPQLEGFALARSQITHPDDVRGQDARRTQEDDELLNLEHALSTYYSEVVLYIGGYIVRTNSKQLHCAVVGLLTADSITSMLV